MKSRPLFPNLDQVASRHASLIAGDRRQRFFIYGGVAAALLLAIFAASRLEFSFARLGAGIGQLLNFITMMFPPTPGNQGVLFLKALGETIAIAFLGTLFAALLALPFGFLAARNIMPVRIVQFLTRRISDTVRGVDTLIWALIWINVVGLGPFAGVLAIIISDFGGFIKLFSEAIETADEKPREGVVASGASYLQGVRFGIVPQVLPVILSQVLYYFESNTRSATIIGIVGAGGIGLHLSEMIRTLEWEKVSFIVILVLVTVAVIDFLSDHLRKAIIGRRAV